MFAPPCPSSESFSLPTSDLLHPPSGPLSVPPLQYRAGVQNAIRSVFSPAAALGTGGTYDSFLRSVVLKVMVGGLARVSGRWTSSPRFFASLRASWSWV